MGRSAEVKPSMRGDAAGHEVDGQVLDGYRLRRAVWVDGCEALYEANAPDGTRVAVRAVCLDAPRARHRPLDNEYTSLRSLAGFGSVPAVVGVGRTSTERYMATTWAPGSHLDRDLRKTLDSDPAPPLAAVARVFAALHARRVAHGDVSRLREPPHRCPTDHAFFILSGE